ncbi:MAG: hypothetical protein GXO21_04825 [Aquificae bacterium]|nr:hypothetical protein [Aquificota bacterium]
MKKILTLKAILNSGYQLKETEEVVEVPFVVLKANSPMTPQVENEPKTVVFTQESLQRIQKDIIGKPVLVDHWESVRNIVGVVSSARVENDTLIATIKIPKTEERLISLIKLKPSPIQEVSIGGYIKAYEESNGLITITDFETKELSLVIKGASPDTKRLDAKQSNKQEDTVLKEQIEKLEKENKELKAKLEEKEKEISKLKEKLEIMELTAYKSEKVKEIDPRLVALAKPALEMATSKEQVDKLIEDYKKMTASLPTFNTPAPTNSSEENPFKVI